MLRKNVKDRIVYERKLREEESVYPKKKPTNSKQRSRNSRIRETASKAIQDLTFLMNNLPEKQLAQVFNKENMKPFFDALLSLDNKDLEDSRIERIRLLWQSILAKNINDHDYMSVLVGYDVYSILVTSDIMTPSKVLSYLSMHEHKDEIVQWGKYSKKQLRLKKKKEESSGS
jgi:hypothetical protein